MSTYLNLNLKKIFKDSLKAYRRNLKAQNVKDDGMSEKERLILTYTQLSSEPEVLLDDCDLAKTLRKNEFLNKTEKDNNCDKPEYHVSILRKTIGDFDHSVPFICQSQKDDDDDEDISVDDSFVNENITADKYFVETNFTNDNNNNDNKKEIMEKSKNESDQFIMDEHIIDIIESVINTEKERRKKSIKTKQTTFKQKNIKEIIAFVPETFASDNSTSKRDQGTMTPFTFNPPLQYFMSNNEKDEQKSTFNFEDIIKFDKNTHINQNESKLQMLFSNEMTDVMKHSNVKITLDFTKLVFPKNMLNKISKRKEGIHSGNQTKKKKQNVKKSKTAKSDIARYVESFSNDCELNELDGDRNNETTNVHNSVERGIQDNQPEQISLSQFDQLFTTTFLGTNENDDYIFTAETADIRSNANIIPKNASQKLDAEPQKQCTIINNCEGATSVETTIPMDEDFVIPKDIETNAYFFGRCFESDSASLPQQLLTEQTADLTVSSIVCNTINVINEHEDSNYQENLNSDGSRGSNILYNSNCDESSVLDLSLPKSKYRRIVNSSDIVGIFNKENTNNAEVDKPAPNKNLNYSQINKDDTVQNDCVSKELLDTTVEDTINRNLSTLGENTVNKYQYDQNHFADNEIHNSVIENEKARSTEGNQNSTITTSIEYSGLYKNMPNLDDVTTSVLNFTNQLTDFSNNFSKDDNNKTNTESLDYEIDDEDALSIYANSSTFSIDDNVQDISNFTEEDNQILDNIPIESSSRISTQNTCSEKQPEGLLKKFKIPKLKASTPNHISSTTEDIVKSPLESVEPVSTTTILYDVPTGTSNIHTKISKIYNAADNSSFSNQLNSVNQFNLFNQFNQFNPPSLHCVTGLPLKQYRSKVYNIFGNLCFDYLQNSCIKLKCKYNHELLDPYKVKLHLMNLSDIIIDSAYHFIWRNFKLFVVYFPVFCEIFAERGDKEKLLLKAKDCEMYTGCMIFMKDIVKGLTKIGIPHAEAIKLTMKNIQGEVTPEMVDIFIDLILESDIFQFIQILEKYSTSNWYRFRMSSIRKLARICVESQHSDLDLILLKIILFQVPPDELNSYENSFLSTFLEKAKKHIDLQKLYKICMGSNILQNSGILSDVSTPSCINVLLNGILK